MRLIDADYLLDVLRVHEDEWDTPDETWRPESDYAGAIKAAPTIEAEPVKHEEWIPCSERLPEVHESGNSFSGIYMQSVPVLVYGICEGEGNAQFHVATYCDDLDGNTYWCTELDAFTITEVKAWMPLPEPYNAESEDKE